MSDVTRNIKVSISGDASGFAKAADTATDSMKHVEKESGDLGETLDKSTGKFRGGKDLLDGFSDSAGALGLAMPGPIGNIAMFAGGLADMADGIATTALPLLKTLWATMLANPFILVAVAVVALGAALVVLYKKSATFRAIVGSAFDGVKEAFDLMKDAAVADFKLMEKAFDTFVAINKKVATVLVAPYRIAFDAIAEAWNHTLGGLHIGIPGFSTHIPGVPSFPGFSFDIPNIPTFATGGVLPNGLALVGERGPELVRMPGASVTPNNMLGSGAMTVEIHATGPTLQDVVKVVVRDANRAVVNAVNSGSRRSFA